MKPRAFACCPEWLRRLRVAACAWLLVHAAVAGAHHDIEIGVIAGLTGGGASYGASIVRGAEMAVREVNAAGGVNGHRLKLIVVDDGSEPARSAIAMRRLISQSPFLIVGGWGSPQVLAHLDFPEQSSIPYIVVGATHPGIVSKSDNWVFRVIQSDSVMAEQLARLVAGRGMKRIAIINDSNAYGSGSRDVFVKALSALGIAPVAVRSYDAGATDFRAELEAIAAAAPDALAIFGTVPAAPAIMKQARALGIKARFLGSGGLANDELIGRAGAASEGTLLTTFFSEDADAASQAWSRRFRRENPDGGRASPGLAAWEYRAIRDIAVPCLRIAGNDRGRLRQCIATWRGVLFGVAGETHFDPTGQLVQPALALEIRDGAFRLLEPRR